jgi:hypothetical protein
MLGAAALAATSIMTNGAEAMRIVRPSPSGQFIRPRWSRSAWKEARSAAIALRSARKGKRAGWKGESRNKKDKHA